MLQRVTIGGEIPFKTSKLEDLILLPQVIRVTKFDDDGVKAFSESMSKAHEVGQPIIPIVIDSYGGSVYGLMSMISMIRSSKAKVATIVEGKAMSAGAALFTFGAKGMRYMSPESRLMIHEVLGFTFGKVEDVKSDSAHFDELNRSLFAMMAENCGHKDPAYFLKVIHDKKRADWYLGAREAIRHGIASHAKMPLLEVRIKSELRLET
jgi:ATP-dependent Clp endopeptidase proteolytic subunit ClpP